jgi:hypothetical protein
MQESVYTQCAIDIALNVLQQIPVAARSKVWVCGHWIAGIVGSNPAGGMEVCLL